MTSPKTEDRKAWRRDTFNQLMGPDPYLHIWRFSEQSSERLDDALVPRAIGSCGAPCSADVFLRFSAVHEARGEGLLSADSVEKQRVAGAESGDQYGARAPFLSGFARLLRCRKDLG